MSTDPDATGKFTSETHGEEPDLSRPEVASEGDAGGESVRLARRIDHLPEPFGEVARLRLLAHWPLSQIAEYLGQSQKYVVSLLLTGVRMLETADEKAKMDADEPSNLDKTQTTDPHATDALLDLLKREDEGESIGRQEASSHHSELVNYYFEVASRLESTDFAVGQTLTGSGDAKSPLSGRQPDSYPPVPFTAGRQSDTVTDLSAQLARVETFGDYDLLEKIGKGGMGVVYKARQRKLKRVVALKMILGGKFAEQIDVRRFYAEAESAAKLRHPNIVAIHEVGEIDGQHFLSMDFVEGGSLREWARDEPLSPERTAALVKTIAEAMQHAHDRGVVHRDLKPANILMDLNQQPAITDFGLAKRVADDASGLTYTGQVLGTPSYMPPEQAAGRISDIGPLADVYSIGAVLYELLTGRPPFRAGTPWETIKQVMQREPVTPRLLNPEVPRDLETICLKCLQKSPDQRYESAQELADELGRFLAGEPIRARPIGPLTRVWRWCKRNPKIAASLTGTAVSILIVLAVVSVSLAVTSEALDKEQAARKQAARSYQQTRDVVDYWFTQLAETPLKDQPGLQKLRRELFERALKHYQDFLKRHGNDPTLHEEIALTHFRIGLITASIAEADQALASFEKALETQRKLVGEQPDNLDRQYHLSNSLTEMGRVLEKLNRTEESMQRHLEARDMRRKLVAAQPDNVEYARKLANSIMNVGIIQRMQFDLAEARKTIQQSQRQREEALEVEPNNRKLRRDLAKGYYNLATIAVDLQQQAYRDDDVESARAERSTGMDALRQAIDLFEELRAKDASDFNLRVQLAMCYNLLADLQRMVWEDSQIAAANLQRQGDEEARKEAERLFQKAAGMLNEAVRLYDDARPILETLARMNPDVAAYQHTLSSLYSDLGMLQIVDNKPVKALQAYEPALDVLNELIEADPNSPTYRRDKAQVLRAIASAQAHPQLEQWDDARGNLEKAIAALTSLRDQFPKDEDYRRLLEETRAGLEELEKLRKGEGS